MTNDRHTIGGCLPQMNLDIMPVLIILQAVESAFICGCCQYFFRRCVHCFSSTIHYSRLGRVAGLPYIRRKGTHVYQPVC